MHPIILDRIATILDRNHIIEQLRVKGRDRLTGELLEYIATAERRSRPKALIFPVTVTLKSEQTVVLDRLEFHSRVLRENLKQTAQAFIVVATAGYELEAWMNTIKDLLYRFWVDHLSEVVLSLAVADAEAEIRCRFSMESLSWMTPGSLEDWPLLEQKKLFLRVGKEAAEIGVRLSEAMVMHPQKSLSGIVFPSVEKFHSCQLCNKQTCQKRRAPYDSKLLKDKYGLAES